MQRSASDDLGLSDDVDCGWCEELTHKSPMNAWADDDMITDGLPFTRKNFQY